jgi:hypothetical protein
MKNTTTFFTFALLSVVLLTMAMAPDVSRKVYAETITADDLRKHLTILASDEYEGRETAEKGQRMAAKYIADQFRSFGIPELKTGGYYQTINLLRYTPGAGSIVFGDQSFSFKKDFYYTSGIENGRVAAEEFVVAGYGINDKKYSDYGNLTDVKGKVVMVLQGEPKDKKGNSLVTGTTTLSDWSTQRRLKVNEARKQGAAALFIVLDDYEKTYNENKHSIESPTVQLGLPLKAGEAEPAPTPMPVLYLSKATAAALLKNASAKTTVDKIAARITKKKRTTRINLSSPKLSIEINRKPENINSENVLGYLEGGDLKDELVVITAHYDHLGIHDGVVFNGADDDGSGTVAVLELAEAFAKAKKDGHGPRRSILFMAVSGEEKGLLGSRWYTESPVFPLQQTVCDLNIDMIGRVDKDHLNDSNYVYVIGSDMLSSELKGITETANNSFTQIKLDYRFDAPDDPNMFYFRSDHYNFARNGIPVAFFFNGVHADYHKETDEVSKIAFNLMERRSRLVFYTAWELVNREQRITADKKK